MNMEFDIVRQERYKRHFMLEEIGEEGQKRLLKSKVLIIGAGGLGSPAALYLAAAGVGTIGIVDGDVVDYSNLQRQILHSTADVGRAKVESAKESLAAINPDVQIKTYHEFVTEDTIGKIIEAYDFVIDATDNFETKFLINDACVRLEKAFCHGGLQKTKGQLMTYIPGAPCYRCVFQEPPGDAVPAGTGIIGAVCGVIGSAQALEAIKYLLGKGDLLTGRLLTFDAMRMQSHIIKLPKNLKPCPVCLEKNKIIK